MAQEVIFLLHICTFSQRRYTRPHQAIDAIVNFQTPRICSFVGGLTARMILTVNVGSAAPDLWDIRTLGESPTLHNVFQMSCIAFVAEYHSLTLTWTTVVPLLSWEQIVSHLSLHTNGDEVKLLLVVWRVDNEERRGPVWQQKGGYLGLLVLWAVAVNEWWRMCEWSSMFDSVPVEAITVNSSKNDQLENLWNAFSSFWNYSQRMIRQLREAVSSLLTTELNQRHMSDCQIVIFHGN